MYTPYTPLFYSKTGVYHFFLIFALKHRLWVLVRTASVSGSNVYSNSMFCAKTRKNIKKFHLKIIIFSTFRNYCILHRGARYFVESHFVCTTFGRIRLLVDVTFRRVRHSVEKNGQVRHSVEMVNSIIL